MKGLMRRVFALLCVLCILPLLLLVGALEGMIGIVLDVGGRLREPEGDVESRHN